MLLVVGNAATADGLFAVADRPLAHEVGVLRSFSRAWYAGGSAAVIAGAAARQGSKVRLWHPLPPPGASEAASDLHRSLREAGVDLGHCPSMERVVHALLIDTPDGRLAWSEEPADVIPDSTSLERLLEGIVHVVFAPRWGPWSDRILHAAQQRGIPVSVIGEIPPVQPGWAIVVADHRQLAEKAPGSTGLLVATRGAQGARISLADRDFDVPAHRVRAIDTTGAGDTFGGTFIASILAGDPPEIAATAAAHSAALACTSIGAIPPIEHVADPTESVTMTIDQSVPASLEQRLSRCEGSLWGQACGDAFGMPNSFLQNPVWRTSMDPGPANSPYHAGYIAGRITDDTEQAQSLTAAFNLSTGRLEASIVASELEKWLDSVGGQDSLAVGPSTKRAMAAFKAGIPVDQAGITGITNGAPMRIGVVGAWAALNDYTFDELLEDVEAACLPTHNTSIAISGAAAVAAAVWAGVRGLGWNETLQQALMAARWGEARGAWIYGPSVGQRIIAACELIKSATTEVEATRILSEVIGMGEPTTESVPAAFAVVAFAQRNPEVAIRVAGNARGDTDTVAAIAGAIAGAVSGPSGFPKAWRDAVADANNLDVPGWSKSLLRR
jgi:ADP-ribosylglycohydrolase/sugar/nucleoside kinase (ribokinase family)